MKTVKCFKKCIYILSLLFLVLSVFPAESECKIRARSKIKIPDVLGFVTLQCDFHMHTVFSDGRVWPTVRADEAWQEGLDAFSITDHIEYQRFKKDIPNKTKNYFNRPYEIAKPRADALNLQIINGAEITRGIPPGHINAIFLNDVNPLHVRNWKDAIKAAAVQGAFIFWNHPCCEVYGSDWLPEHTELYEQGYLHGIEVVNGEGYCPMAHKLCLEKKLTMMGNSDSHAPVAWDYYIGEHRSITLVLARTNTKEAIKKALFERRTVVYWKEYLIGEEKYVRPIFNKSIDILNPDIAVKGKSRASVQISNTSDISYELVLDGEVENITPPETITLPGDKTVILNIEGKSNELSGRKKISIPYIVKNLLIAPDEGLPIELTVNVTFTPVKKK